MVAGKLGDGGHGHIDRGLGLIAGRPHCPGVIPLQLHIDLGAIGQRQAVILVDLEQGTEVPAPTVAGAIEVGQGIVSTIGVSIGIDPIDVTGGEGVVYTGPEAPLLVDAIGDIGVQIDAHQGRLTRQQAGGRMAARPEAVVEAGAQAVVGHHGETDGPLVVDGVDHVGGGDDRVGAGVTMTCRRAGVKPATRQIGDKGPVHAVIRIDHGGRYRDGGLVEHHHGSGVATQHGGAVGDGPLTREGSAKAGGGVFVDLEAGG
ncbi:hypothetical protein D3C86_1303180 [compost metagenome]